jgi:hypothetical protein
MDANGCQPGDRWFINELPTSWFKASLPESTHAAVRARIANVLRGLALGTGGDLVPGFTADVVWGHNTFNVSDYKPPLERAYAANLFWSAIRPYVLGWGDETYNRCSQICVANQTAATVADRGINNYSFHESYLASVAPSTAAYSPVKTVLGGAYMPILNGIWRNPKPVFDSEILIRQMTRVIREQIYAARRAASATYGAHGRISFAWRESGFATSDDGKAADQLADNLAIAIRNAYRVGGTAAAACTDNDGSGIHFYGCPPAAKAGAAFNPTWDAFKRW